MELKYIDLFCGIGGFHKAFDELKCNSRCLIACDIDKNCCEMYNTNFNIIPHKNIKDINENTIEEEIDIFCGGFPCQSFSNAGKKKTFEDERGLLFDEIIRLAKIYNPKIMFLENVS